MYKRVPSRQKNDKNDTIGNDNYQNNNIEWRNQNKQCNDKNKNNNIGNI